MLLIIWILPIQMFRTTVVLVVAAAIGFVVFRRQLAAESAGAGTRRPSPRSGSADRPTPPTRASALAQRRLARQSPQWPWSTTSCARMP